MKIYNSLLLGSVVLFAFASCDHTVSMETTVHEDGSLDKTIIIEVDSSNFTNNFMGIGEASGWQMLVNEKDSANKKDEKKFLLTFSKHFQSAADANQELASPNDTLFRVTSNFEKKFRWFYTYLYYSDTYHAINRLSLPTEDYFTEEDYAFIDRLPAEGSSISKADSLYLDRLNEKIFDHYGSRALFEFYYSKLELLLKQQNKIAWIDTLKNHKEAMYASLMENDGAMNLQEIEGMSRLPLTENELSQLEAEIETRVDFFSLAANGKYHHTINLPGSVVKTNADSVAGNSLYWRPSTTRFLLKDYILYGESRRLNIWTVLVSVTLIIGALFLIFNRRR
jgi:hypothetical protein